MLTNQKGIAVFEIVPILAVFILLLNFAIGFFGAIHSGILNSIAARNYAFETFRNRTSLNYLRDISKNETDYGFSYMKAGFRYHGTVSDGARGDEDWSATKRNIKFTEARSPAGNSDANSHNQNVLKVATGSKASDVISEGEFDSVWVRTIYGICINSKCGD